MPEQTHLAVYGEVNANLVDGSSVWLQSICLTLAKIPGVRVTCLLRAPVERDLLLRPLVEHPAIELVEPGRWQTAGLLTPLGAIGALSELDDSDRFDFVILRGAAVVDAACQHGRFDGRVWLYHVPVADADPAELVHQGGGAHRVLCQTEAIVDQVAAVAPELAPRLLLLPPMIPTAAAVPTRPSDGPIRQLFYAGKLSPEYLALEMIELLRRLRPQLPGLELHVAGDKIHNPPQDPSFRERTRAALEDTDGVVWHGAVGREEVADLLRSADVALSIRHPSLDASAEMSTKVLEYGAAGCPVLLNPTSLHRRLLGADYPLLAGDLDQAEAALLAASRDPARRREAGVRVEALSRRHSFEAVAELIAPHLDGGEDIASHQPQRQREGGVRLLVAGHSFGFAAEVMDRARASGAELREDRWQGHAVNDEAASEEGAEWAHSILCEWCLGNAVWYSRRKRSDQRLLIRFHRMELETPYPGEVDLEQVDAIVFVARHVLEAACERYGWAVEDPRFAVLPNAVEAEQLRLPKLPDAEFTLGLIGFVPRVKRIDRALDLLERLRARDDRYRLVVKGRGPWEYDWMAAREDERRYYEDAFRRIERSPALRQSVVFEPFGDDISAFLQQIGWILSTSEIEGHSVALAEGMSSGAIPVVIERPGARDQYDRGWVHGDAEAAAAAIFATSQNGERKAEAERASHFSERWSWEEIWPSWDRLLGLANTP